MARWPGGMQTVWDEENLGMQVKRDSRGFASIGTYTYIGCLLTWGSCSTTGAVAQLWDGHFRLPTAPGTAGGSQDPVPGGAAAHGAASAPHSGMNKCAGMSGLRAQHEHVEAVYCQGCCRPCSASPNQPGRCGHSAWGQWGPSPGRGWATAGIQGWVG